MLRKVLIVVAILTTIAFVVTRLRMRSQAAVVADAGDGEQLAVPKPKPAVPRTSGPKPPNVVLIVIDTLRRDHLGCYGYSKPTTPQIDKLAAQGVRAEEMIASCSWTIPSLMSIFTSLPPSLHQATFRTRFGAGITTLADELHGQGFQTVGYASNPFAKTANGFSLGFDEYTEFDGLMAEMHGERKPPPIWEVRSSATVTRLASKWLDGRNAAQPFFLFALYFDPHADYVPVPPNDTLFDPDYTGTVKGNLLSMPDPKLNARDRAHVEALYDGEIRDTDGCVGELIAKIDALGLANDTIVVVTSDHGEEFWNHGQTLHGHTLYDELLRVPFVVRWPGHVEAGKALSGQISSMSIMPTVIEAVGGRIPVQCQSPSVWNFLTGKAPLEARPVCAETDYQGINLRMIRTPTQKIVYDVEKGTKSIFDLVQDPKEQTNLADKPPIWVAELNGEFDVWAKSVNSIRSTMAPARDAELDAKTLEQLKQLGYGQ